MKFKTIKLNGKFNKKMNSQMIVQLSYKDNLLIFWNSILFSIIMIRDIYIFNYKQLMNKK